MNFDNAIHACKAGFEASYAPYSNYHVGAALVCKNGKIYTFLPNGSYKVTVSKEGFASVEKTIFKCALFSQFWNLTMIIPEVKNHLKTSNIKKKTCGL